MASLPRIKPVVWVGGSKDDLVAFPEEVVSAIGYALYEAHKGNKHPDAKRLHGFGGAGALEVVEGYEGDTYRAVYTVRLSGRCMCFMPFRRSQRRGPGQPRPRSIC